MLAELYRRSALKISTTADEFDEPDAARREAARAA